jgi:hypothetical protein
MGLVSNKYLLNIKDMNDIEKLEKITEKKYAQDNMLNDIIKTLREKINAPTRRNR